MEWICRLRTRLIDRRRRNTAQEQQGESKAGSESARRTSASQRQEQVYNATVRRIVADSERRHYWYRSRNRVIDHYLRQLGLGPPRPANLLEIGCGSGVVPNFLNRRGYDADGIELLPDFINSIRRASPSARVWRHDISQPGLENRHRANDAVALFDVLEHVADPVGFLRDSLPFVRKDGLLIGTVPALDSLWSEFDIEIGHYRRYKLKSLRAELEQAGLAVVRM